MCIVIYFNYISKHPIGTCFCFFNLTKLNVDKGFNFFDGNIVIYPYNFTCFYIIQLNYII